MLEIEYVSLEELQRHPRNPKAHDLDAIGRSVNRFGFTSPVIVDERTGYLAAGHGRIDTLAALKASGVDAPANVQVGADGSWRVPVVRGVSFNSDAEIEAYLLADNQLTIMGGWNEEALAALFSSIEDADADLLAVTGFTEREISAIMDSVRAASGSETGDATETEPDRLLAKWNVNVGDVWRIPSGKGEHRVICGDATDAGVVAALMQTDRADCMWTDPPYGVEYEGGTKDALRIENDGAADLPALLNAAFAAADGALIRGAAIYIAHPAGPLHMLFDRAVEDAGWKQRQVLVWVKSSIVLGRSDYHYAHEPLLYAIVPGAPGRRGRGGDGWYGDNSQSSVLVYDKPNANKYHPTMKPVGLVAQCISNSAPVGGLVYDPFGGSGTTLIAAQITDRLARLIELDPRYVSVILERAAEAGLTPERIDANDG